MQKQKFGSSNAEAKSSSSYAKVKMLTLQEHK